MGGVPTGGGLRATARLRESGYTSIVLERLVLHACTIFDAAEVCVFGRDHLSRDDAPVVVQAAGVDPDLIGRRLPIECDPMVAALACGRPLAIPGELWPDWDGARGPGATESAAVAPIWFGGRIRGRGRRRSWCASSRCGERRWFRASRASRPSR